jgi:hypothetical protein
MQPSRDTSSKSAGGLSGWGATTDWESPSSWRSQAAVRPHRVFAADASASAATERYNPFEEKEEGEVIEHKR